MAKKAVKKVKRGSNLDIDSLFKEKGYIPPKINVRRAIDKAIRNKTARISDFSYTEVAKSLGLKNSNNIAKWFNSESLSFNTLKMIMYVLNCPIEDLIEPAKKIRK